MWLLFLALLKDEGIADFIFVHCQMYVNLKSKHFQNPAAPKECAKEGVLVVIILLYTNGIQAGMKINACIPLRMHLGGKKSLH